MQEVLTLLRPFFDSKSKSVNPVSVSSKQRLPTIALKPSQLSPKTLEQIKSILETKMYVSGIPGVACAISEGPGYRTSFGLGYSDVENAVPCEHDAVMRIGSISKTVFVCSVVPWLRAEP